MTKIMLSTEQSQYTEPSRYVPEKGLLAAILERAFRDLEANVDVHHRVDAIRWFQGRRIHSRRYTTTFTFEQIANVLELSAYQIEYIMCKVSQADDKSVQKRKKS